MTELKYTKHLLSKIEELFQELKYTVRYAKGNFQSGYCVVEQQNVAVINKFFETEGRINILMEILDNLEVNEAVLSEKGLRTYQQIIKAKAKQEQETVMEEEDDKP